MPLNAEFESLPSWPQVSAAEMESRTMQFLATARRRRSIRSFADTPVPQAIIENCIRVAATAPSGANQQPWHFVAISDPSLKHRIRLAAEAEEREFYHGRAPFEWLKAVAPMGTDEHKPFLETAPWLIAIFAESFRPAKDGPEKNYYVSESVGIAAGLLIAALTHCGLGTLTHTPSPMRFLNQILDRPSHQRPYLLLVVGFPAMDCQVPKLNKKPFEEISTFVTPG